MSFFDEVSQRARDAGSRFGERAREAVDSARISAAILAEKRELAKSYQIIGQWYLCEHPGEVPEAIANVVEAARASQEKIAELQARREEAEEEEAKREAEEPAGTVCPVCGKISDTKFCPHCGAPMGG